MSGSAPDPGRVAALLERLIADADFRARFRRDPETACARFGLAELGPEIAQRGKALQTLELRESRSSLAGAISAVAAEAVGLLDIAGQARAEPHTPGGRALGAALTRVDIPAVARSQGIPPRQLAEHNLSGGQGHEPVLVHEPVAPTAAPPPPADPPPPPRYAEPSAAARAHGGGHQLVAPEPLPPDAGGETTRASVADLLHDPRFTAWAPAHQDLLDRVADPRVVAVLNRLLEHHEIGVSVIKTGHSKFVAGTTSVSNHFSGRAVDIASVDGELVRPDSQAAHTLVEELNQLPAEFRPNEVGSPWDIGRPGYFTNAAHQNHIHLGFDGPPPADLAAALRDRAPQPQVAVDHAAAGAAGSAISPDAPSGPATPGVPAPPAALRSAVFAAVRQPPPAPPNTLARLAHATPQHPAPEPHAPTAADPAAATALPQTGRYPGDTAPRAQIAQWMAARAQQAGLPPELPIMAALRESGLRNVNYGDRDSLGFFQMRTSIWNRGDYAGYPTNPDLQLKWFIDHALAVKRARINAGDTTYGQDPDHYGTWIADIEQPAAQYRDAYQPNLPAAHDLIARPAADERRQIRRPRASGPG